MNTRIRSLVEKLKLKLVRIAHTAIVALLVAVPGTSQAFHFPWDQGHDTTDWDDPNDPGPCEGSECDPCKSTRSPVYVPTGHFIWTDRDIAIPGRPGLSLTRTFNSHDPRDGIFGRGWTTNCDVALLQFAGSEFDENDAVRGTSGFVMRASDGKRYSYRRGASGAVTAPTGRYERVQPQSDGTILAASRDGTSRTYSTGGRLMRESSPAGLIISYAYDASGRLSRMTDAANRYMQFTYNSRGRVETVSDNAGRTWQYGYDVDGNLTSATNPDGGIRRYEYQPYTPTGDGNTYYRLTRVVDESGIELTQVIYNGERVQSYTSQQNRFTYAHTASTRTVTKTDSMSSQWTYTYDAAGQILTERDPLGGVERYDYGTNSHVTRYVDAMNGVWQWTYDADGRITSATNPADETITWQYNTGFPYPTRAISPTGRITQATYDTNGNMTGLVDPTGARTTLVWTPQGTLSEVRNALNRSTRVTTDAAGLPTTIVDAQNRTTTIAYDAVGRINSVTNSQNEQLRFEYDNVGLPTALVEPSGARTTYDRDEAGRIEAITDPAGRITRYEYDTYGRVSARVLPDGRRFSFAYRSDNLISQTTRPDGSVEQYGYDAAKRLISASAGTESITYNYNARHELTSATNATGTVALTYDTVGRLLTETVGGRTSTYVYNAEGERTGLTHAVGNYQFARDGRGYVTGITAPEGAYGFEYDAISRRQRLVYPNGTVAQYGYNNADQLSQLSYAGPFSETLSYQYEPSGRLSQITSGQGTWTLGHDSNGQLTAAARGAQSFSYQYDAAGNPIGAGQVYDTGNRLTQDARYIYTHDGNGNLTQKQDRSTGARTLYRWNGWNQLRAVERYPDGAATTPTETIAYAYDALKRRSTRSIGSVSETFVYDGQDRIGRLNAAGTVVERVTFGPRVDEPLAINASAGQQYLHADQLGSIIGVSDNAASVGRYEYGPYGETLASAQPAVGSPFRYTAREFESEDLYFYRARYYDPQQARFLSQDPLGLAGGDTNLYRYAANNPIQISDPNGELAWFAIPIIWGAIEIGLSIYDAYDTASTLADQCKTAGEKWLAGGLFMMGAVLPGGGYSAADDIITSKPVKEGIYEFVDTTGKKYGGQSSDIPQRLQQHVDSGKLDPGQHVDVNPMPGSTKTEREIAEHRRIQEITGGVPARQSDAVSNQRDPIGPKRQHLLNDPP